jgi:TatD DNase family protein
VLIDSHCHVYMADFDADRPAVLARARSVGLGALIAIGYDLPSSRQAIDLAERESNVYACVAVHPHHAADLTPAALTELEGLASHPKVVGVGEIGLDYFRNLSSREAQETAFRAQLHLADALRLPVAIHDREAHADTMRILSEDARRLRAVVLHCFSGDGAMAAEAWSRGYFIGVGGPLTYPNAGALRGILAGAPRDRVLLETDAPYLPPAPHRGKRNEPAYLRLVVERLAALWDADPDSVAEAAARNTCRAFGVQPRGKQG